MSCERSGKWKDQSKLGQIWEVAFSFNPRKYWKFRWIFLVASADTRQEDCSFHLNFLHGIFFLLIFSLMQHKEKLKMNHTDSQFSGKIKSMEKIWFFLGLRTLIVQESFSWKEQKDMRIELLQQSKQFHSHKREFGYESEVSRLFRDAGLDMFALLTLFVFSIFDFLSLSSTPDYIGLDSAVNWAAFSRKSSFATVIKL